MFKSSAWRSWADMRQCIDLMTLLSAGAGRKLQEQDSRYGFHLKQDRI